MDFFALKRKLNRLFSIPVIIVLITGMVFLLAAYLVNWYIEENYNCNRIPEEYVQLFEEKTLK